MRRLGPTLSIEKQPGSNGGDPTGHDAANGRAAQALSFLLEPLIGLALTGIEDRCDAVFSLNGEQAEIIGALLGKYSDGDARRDKAQGERRACPAEPTEETLPMLEPTSLIGQLSLGWVFPKWRGRWLDFRGLWLDFRGLWLKFGGRWLDFRCAHRSL